MHLHLEDPADRHLRCLLVFLQVDFFCLILTFMVARSLAVAAAAADAFTGSTSSHCRRQARNNSLNPHSQTFREIILILEAHHINIPEAGPPELDFTPPEDSGKNIVLQ